MFTLTVSLDSFSLYIVAADVLILLAYILYLFQKKRNLEKSIKSITEFITEYFMNTGAKVEITCFKLEGHNRFVTLIESEPLKRFRYSNILERNLIAHTFKVTGNVVEKIYWRFPVPINKEAIAAEDKTNPVSDEYFLDVQSVVKIKSGYEVSDASWNEFEIKN